MVAIMAVYMAAMMGMIATWVIPYSSYFPTYYNQPLTVVSLGTTIGMTITLIVGFVGAGLPQKLGPKKMMMIGSFCVLIYPMLIAVSNNVIFFYLAWCVMGIAIALPTHVTATMLVSNWYVKDRAAKTGITIGVSCIGTAIFQFIAGLILNSMGVKPTFVILGICAFVITMICALLIKDTPETIGQKAYGWEEMSGLASAGADVTEAEDKKKAVTSGLYRTMPFWLILFGFLFASKSCNYACDYATMVLPLCGFQFTTASTVVSACNLLNGLFMMLIMGKWIEKSGPKVVLIISMIAAIICNGMVIILGHTPSTIVLVVMIATYIVGFCVANICNLIIPQIYKNTTVSNAVNSKTFAVVNGMSLVMSPLTAAIIDAFHWSGVYWLIIAMDIVAVIIFLILFAKVKEPIEEV